jgi:hypothetical protein
MRIYHVHPYHGLRWPDMYVIYTYIYTYMCVCVCVCVCMCMSTIKASFDWYGRSSNMKVMSEKVERSQC